MKIRVKVELRADHPNPGNASPAWADRASTVDVTLDDSRQGGNPPTVGTIDAIGKVIVNALKAMPR